ncbi:MAG TPA: DUF4062 domain-containing protein [Pseudonocardiaceae bacterium]|nr:DUF4062 domain-containing protein [Pseudonocardiaceae bacterium]
MARIYVSSTYRDLREHREAVCRALRQFGHDVVAMEDYVAADQRPLQRCLADVAASDVYLGILAWRYGYRPEQDNPEGRSITELEYREARRRGIPCLWFLLDENAPWPRNLIDRGADGQQIEAQRSTLAREHTVSVFRTPDQLAAATVTAVSRLISDREPDGLPGRPVAVGARVLMLYARSDQRFAAELGHHLGGLRREGVVAQVRELRVDRDANRANRTNRARESAIRSSDLVLLMVSSDLVTSGYLDQAEFGWLLDLHRARQPQLVPVMLRPVEWKSLPPGLSRIPPLPSGDHSVVEASNREAAFVEVVEGIRLACLDLAATRTHSSRSEPAVVRHRGPGRVQHRLVEVFKESGVPSVTFVEPDDFYRLRLALEQPGRGVVIEGPSGVGKTTALQTALNQLDHGSQARFEVLSCRDGAHVERLRQLRQWHRGPVAIDDFHRLDPPQRRELADYLKLLADTERPDRKLVIVGIPGTGQRLVDIAFDIATRIEILSLGTVSDDKVLEMIGKGEAALNVDLIGKSEIVRASAGSLNIAQVLCKHMVALAGIRETQTITTPVDTPLANAIDKAMKVMALKFGTMARSFAALGGPHDRLCLELLYELAEAKDGMLRLWPLRARRPELAAGIDRFIHTRRMDSLGERHTAPDRHLLYDAESATLVIDDPQLTFYLRQLNFEQLALDAGKRTRTHRTRIFISYSHHDRDWCDRLRVHLRPIERDGKVDLWDDTRIAAGQIWRDEIDAALDSAVVAVLLISPDFLASDFIMDNELPPLLTAAENRGCTILPLLVRPSLFTERPELNRFQTVNSNTQPLAAMSEVERDTVLVALAQRIVALVTQSRRDSGPP